MSTSSRFIRFVVWTLALCLVLAGPMIAVASPRMLQEPTPTETPTDVPTDVPTETPTDVPPTETPTGEPTTEPTPTDEPTTTPTDEPTATPTEVSSPSPSPSESPSPSPSESPSPSPSESPAPSESPSPSPSESPSPSPEPGPDADYELVVGITADRTQVRVGETMNFTLTLTNQGTEAVSGQALAAAFFSSCFAVTEAGVTVSRDFDEKFVESDTEEEVTGVYVFYTGQAVGETITINIAATVTCVPAEDEQYAAAIALTEEESARDDEENNLAYFEFTVLPAAGGSPAPSATPAPTVQPTAQPTAQPSASPGTPSQLPDTGASSGTALVLLVTAGTLLGMGFAAQVALRRRSAR